MTLAERNIIFEDLFKSHFHQLYVHACRWVNDEECAKDIVHDSFCYLWEHFEHYTDHSRLLPLLYTFVKSRSIDFLRQAQAKEHYLEEQVHGTLSPDETYDGYEELVTRAMQALRKLPPQTRRVFVECVLHRHTYKETGELLGISPLTVKTLMARALKTLRSQPEFFSPVLTLLGVLAYTI